MVSYIDSLVTTLGEAGPRPMLHQAGTGTTGAGLLTSIYRYARVLDELAAARSAEPLADRARPGTWP